MPAAKVERQRSPYAVRWVTRGRESDQPWRIARWNGSVKLTL